MTIIPAIDIINGEAVRLSQGDYNIKTIYSKNPVELAREFEAHGFTRLHLVDLDGAKAGSIKNLSILQKICTGTTLQVDFGGGLKRDEDVKSAFDSGASQICVGSIAVKDPQLFTQWLKEYGPDKIILSADVKAGKIATHGWLNDSGLDAMDFIKEKEVEGVTYVMCTDVSKDGMLAGPSLALYREIISGTQLKLIASGGVATLGDLHALKHLGCEAVVVGKAIYENRISLPELSAYA